MIDGHEAWAQLSRIAQLDQRLPSRPMSALGGSGRAAVISWVEIPQRSSLSEHWGCAILSVGRTGEALNNEAARVHHAARRRGGAWPLAARAQQAERVRRVGVLMLTSSDEPESQTNIAAFLQGLQEAGWAVGRNLRIDYRWSGNDRTRLNQHATELISLGPDVVLAGTGGTTPVLRQASAAPYQSCLRRTSTRSAQAMSRACRDLAPMPQASPSSSTL